MNQLVCCALWHVPLCLLKIDTQAISDVEKKRNTESRYPAFRHQWI